jgi:hypothetical protein
MGGSHTRSFSWLLRILSNNSKKEPLISHTTVFIKIQYIITVRFLYQKPQKYEKPKPKNQKTNEVSELEIISNKKE